MKLTKNGKETRAKVIERMAYYVGRENAITMLEHPNTLGLINALSQKIADDNEAAKKSSAA